jgi:hypothetical protein
LFRLRVAFRGQRSVSTIGVDEACGRPVGLFTGLAGVVETLRYFAAELGDRSLYDQALVLADAVERQLTGQAGSSITPDSAGLLRGYSGVAVMFTHLFDDTGDERYLDLAMRALTEDLKQCEESRDGALFLLDARKRLLPYLADGSGGIGVAIRTYLRRRPDPSVEAALTPIRLAVSSPFCALSGLAEGRAGLALALRHLGDASSDALRMHMSRLSWHSVEWSGGIAFVGEQMFRLSMDLMTGSAGVLLSAANSTGQTDASLPYLVDDVSATGLLSHAANAALETSGAARS